MNKFINATLQLKDKNIVFEDKVEEMIVKNIMKNQAFPAEKR